MEIIIFFSRLADRYEHWYKAKIDSLPLDEGKMVEAREVISANSSRSKEEIEEELENRELPPLQDVGKASVSSFFIALPASILMGLITKLRGSSAQ